MKKTPKMEESNRLSQSMLEYYRNNPVAAAKNILGITLNAYQRILFKASWKVPFLCWLLSRGLGKTFCGAIFLVLKAILYPKMNCGIIASSFRQSLFVFDKIEAFYYESEIFQEETIKPPSRGMYQAIVKFKNGSMIEALPLGDGNKIRGRRYNLIFLDEYAQIPETIINLVIMPMMIVKRNYNPDKKTGSEDSNQLLVASTAYYQWNHYFKLVRQFINEMASGNRDYYLAVFDYEDGLICGLLDEKQIKKQKESMTEEEFDMEYRCKFPASDSGQFIKQSSIDKVSTEKVEVKLVGDPDKRYVMGVDVARQGGGDNFALHLIEINEEKHQTFKDAVRTITLNGRPFQEMNDLIRETLNHFSVIGIWMDAGGGGLALKDLLAQPWVDPETGDTLPPILDAEDESIPDEIRENALNILHMVNFTPAIVHQMGIDVKAAIQRGTLRFPVDIHSDSDPDYLQACLEMIATKREIVQIRANPSGNYFRYDPPKKSRYRKDRWTAVNLAVLGCKQCLENDSEGTVVGGWIK